MTRLPALTPRQVVAALHRAGFSLVRQAGSHAQFRHATRRELRVTVPMHAKTLKRGTLQSILRQADLTAEAFRALL